MALGKRESVLPAQKSNCFQFTQTTTLDSEVPSVDDFQPGFLTSSHQRMQTAPHFTLLLLYSALPLPHPLWHNVHLHQSEVYFWSEHEIAWNLSKNLIWDTLLIMEHINMILCLLL